MQFQIISHTPSEKPPFVQLSTFATDEIGDTPSSPCFVKATPSAEKNRLIINKTYLLAVSFFDIFVFPWFFDSIKIFTHP